MANDKIFEGSVLEEALQAAAASTGIAEPDLDYEIIEQGRRGLFGIGARSVRIRVMPPLAAVSEEEAPPRRRSRSRSRGRGGRGQKGEKQPQSQDQGQAQAQQSPVQGKSQSKGKKRSSRRSGRSRSQSSTPRSRPAAAPAASAEDAAKVQETVERMLELLPFDLTAKAEPAEGGVRVVIEGPEREELGTKDPEFFPALQFLLNRMSRRNWPDVGRIMLGDDENRENRDQELIELTHEVARQVGRTDKAKQLHEMNAYERRLVHLAVREYDDLGSRSEGSGYLKRVRIYKQKDGGSRRPPAADKSR